MAAVIDVLVVVTCSGGPLSPSTAHRFLSAHSPELDSEGNELAVEAPESLRVAVAFDELATAI
jgi:hypothetical protein